MSPPQVNWDTPSQTPQIQWDDEEQKKRPDFSVNPPGVPRPRLAMETYGPTGEMPGAFEGHPENIGEWVPAGPGEVAGGARDVARGNIARGGHRIISGVGNTLLPTLPFAAAAAPVMTGRALLGGAAGGYAAEKGAEEFGATPDQAALAGDVGNLVGGGLATRRGIVSAPVRLGARAAETAANQKFVPLKPLLNIMTPADEAEAVRFKIPGRDFGLPVPEAKPVYPGAPQPATPPASFLRSNAGVFPGAPLPAVPAPEILNPALASESRTMPGQVGSERIFGPRPTPAAAIPRRGGLMLEGEVAPDVAETAPSLSRIEGVPSNAPIDRLRNLPVPGREANVTPRPSVERLNLEAPAGVERRAPTSEPYLGAERRGPIAKPELGFLTAPAKNPEDLGFDFRPPEDLGNKVRPGTEEKLGPIKRTGKALRQSEALRGVPAAVQEAVPAVANPAGIDARMAEILDRLRATPAVEQPSPEESLEPILRRSKSLADFGRSKAPVPTRPPRETLDEFNARLRRIADAREGR